METISAPLPSRPRMTRAWTTTRNSLVPFRDHHHVILPEPVLTDPSRSSPLQCDTMGRGGSTLLWGRIPAVGSSVWHYSHFFYRVSTMKNAKKLNRVSRRRFGSLLPVAGAAAPALLAQEDAQHQPGANPTRQAEQ